MTYQTDNQVRKYVRGNGFMSFAKKFGSKYGKTFLNKGISASKRIKNVASKLNQSKYGKILKKKLVSNFLTKLFLQQLMLLDQKLQTRLLH